MPAPTGADALVRQLEALGVGAVFGIPGVHNLAIFDALERSAIRTVLVRHEQTAGYAADGYARATGQLGVAITTTGPGAANTAGAMGEARAARSPVLQISTQVSSRVLAGRSGSGVLHESPQQRELFAALTLASRRVASAGQIPGAVARAARDAFGGRRGPVFLEIPFDLLDAPSRNAVAPRPVRPPMPDARTIRRTAMLLGRAARPIIWAGGGAISSGASGSVRAIAETLGAPVVTTYSGRGILPASHPLLVGFPPHEPAVTTLVESADAILIVGSDLDAMNTMGWRIAFPHPRIVVNTHPRDLARNVSADVALRGDAHATLERLVAALPKRRRSDPVPRVRAVRAACRRAHRDDDGYVFARTVGRSLDAGTVLLCDMAVGGYWLAGYHQPAGPRRFQYPMGWGTLGFALPASVGAAVAGRRALVVCGDAGFLFAAGELATLAQEQLPVCVLVVNDGGYGMLRFDEQERFGRHFADSLTTPDFVALAGAFDIPSRRVTMRGLDTALAWAQAQPGPALLELRAAFTPPPTTSPAWHRKDAPEVRR